MGKSFNLATAEERVKFMEQMGRGDYSGTNENNEDTLIYVSDKGMTIKTYSGTNHFACVDYDINGIRECDYFES